MTDTAINVEETSQNDIPHHPSDLLANLVVTLLVPMFLAASAGDIGLARMAAIETVNTYRVRNHANLIAVAHIIAFGLATLASLSLSMADDISPSMALRLRGNANALNRSAERHRRVLRESRGGDPIRHPATTEPEPRSAAAADDSRPESAMFPSLAVSQTLAAEAQARLQHAEPPAGEPQLPSPAPIFASTTSDSRHQEIWAIAMVKQADEFTASIANLPPAERRTASLRVAALRSTAHDLLHGTPVPPLKPGALARINQPDSGERQRRL